MSEYQLLMLLTTQIESQERNVLIVLDKEKLCVRNTGNLLQKLSPSGQQLTFTFYLRPD